MKEYILKLYGPPSSPRGARRLVGEWALQADDAEAARAQATEMSADIPEGANAVLYGSDQAPLWSKLYWNA